MALEVISERGVRSAQIVDEPLRPLLLAAASRLTHASVLMLNKNGDEIFSVPDTTALFERLPGKQSRLIFSDGAHDDWPDELIEESLQFIAGHASEEAETDRD